MAFQYLEDIDANAGEGVLVVRLLTWTETDAIASIDTMSTSVTETSTWRKDSWTQTSRVSKTSVAQVSQRPCIHAIIC